MNLNDVDLLSLQTSYMQKDPFTIALCRALNPHFKKLAEETKLVFIYARIDELDEPIIDELAWQMHVDFYDNTLSLDKKRALVKNSLKWHMYKGTPAAVEELVSVVFNESWVEEWFQYNGDSYMFKIFTTDVIESGLTFKKIIEAVDSVKNKRSWLESIVVKRENKMNLNIGIMMRKRKKIVLKPDVIDDISISTNLNIGIANRQLNKISVSEVR
ncbi:phage tail protein, P2 protein I family [Gottschalkia purinilytica]|uniref:Phage tail protein, P2 protein I family n=1 Tax=Gottschalkia purinilytica TaxID=1503 RepID=A0A0L0WAL2_GOTPU|nr:phage tail protein I [Gottschalkia purinilytica]KNF08564.1 phage tail protein, P2 protein I family [Gottschalkia purinilytica]